MDLKLKCINKMIYFNQANQKKRFFGYELL